MDGRPLEPVSNRYLENVRVQQFHLDWRLIVSIGG